MAAGAVAVATFGHVPVAVAVGSVVVLAESCIVVEPGGVDWGEGQERPERLGDLLRPAGISAISASCAIRCVICAGHAVNAREQAPRNASLKRACCVPDPK